MYPKTLPLRCMNFVAIVVFSLCRRLVSVTAYLLGLWVRIPPEVWRSVSCECCLLSGRGLCVGLITRPEESYRVVSECDCEASVMRWSWPTWSPYVMRRIEGC
jgi:hypothetical protein